jgi:transposase
MAHMTVMTGPERRRHWSDDERRKIVAAANAPGAVVAAVARQYDVATSLIYKWRRQQREMAGEMAFVPAIVIDEENMPSVPALGLSPAIVVDMPRGVRVSIHGEAPAALVCAALKALR